jgi:hypothetical protein
MESVNGTVSETALWIIVGGITLVGLANRISIGLTDLPMANVIKPSTEGRLVKT